MNKPFIKISKENPLSRWRERARVRVAFVFRTTLIRPFGHLLPPAGEGKKANTLHTLFFLILSAFSAFPANAAENKLPPLSEEDKKQFNDFLNKLAPLNTVILDCAKDFEVSGQYGVKIVANSISNRYLIIKNLYRFSSRESKQEKRTPSKSECFAEIDKMEFLYKQYNPLIERLYKAIPTEILEEY